MEKEIIVAIIISGSALLTSIFATIISFRVAKKQNRVELKKSSLDILNSRITKLESINEEINNTLNGQKKEKRDLKFSEEIFVRTSNDYFEIKRIFKTIDYMFNNDTIEKFNIIDIEIAQTFAEFKLYAEKGKLAELNMADYHKMIDKMSNQTKAIENLINNRLKKLTHEVDLLLK